MHMQLKILKLIKNSTYYTLNKSSDENVLSRTVALIFHNDLPIIALHCMYVIFLSSPNFTSLYLTSLHFW
jgi:hypothetical protein